MKAEPVVIYQDSQILVLAKPANLSVTKSETEKLPSLQDYLTNFFQLGKSSGIGGRAGIVHRLDKDTSGLILVAKTAESFESLQKQFAARLVEKTYITLVHGIAKTSHFEVDLPVARGKFGKFATLNLGKVATTSFRLIKKYQFGEKFEQTLSQFSKNWQRYFEQNAKFYTLLAAQPKTGRTHQIRVHAKAVKLPIVSDPLYNPRKLLRFDARFCPRLFLHAKNLSFTHPKTGKLVTFEAELPADLTAALLYLKEIP